MNWTRVTGLLWLLVRCESMVVSLVASRINTAPFIVLTAIVSPVGSKQMFQTKKLLKPSKPLPLPSM
jgi:hypothetical protein